MRNKGRKLGNCTCDNCGVEFSKPQSEIIRNQKLGRKNFCSRTCVGKNNIKNLGEGSRLVEEMVVEMQFLTLYGGEGNRCYDVIGRYM